MDGYIRINNETIVKRQAIKWIKKLDECYYFCTKSDGCNKKSAHKACLLNDDKTINNDYQYIETLFKSY